MMSHRWALMTCAFFAFCTAMACAESWGWLGVGIQAVSEELSWELTARFGPLEGNGVQVVEVFPHGAARALILSPRFLDRKRA